MGKKDMDDGKYRKTNGGGTAAGETRMLATITKETFLREFGSGGTGGMQGG